MATAQAQPQIVVRPLAESDLADADRIIRLAFGTFLGMPNPQQFMGDAGYAYTRWKADPSAAVGAEHEGRLVGSNFASNWGSFGFFGPLTIEPEYWGRGVAQQLVAATMEIFRRWGNRHLGLFTFAHSPKHMALYQKFGFWPRDLVAVMAKPIVAPEQASTIAGASLYSDTKDEHKTAVLEACREVTRSNFEGLDVNREIRAAAQQSLGDTVLAWDGERLAGLAVCHTGAGSEAGSGTCFIKFAAIRPGATAERDFGHLLKFCESFAARRGAQKLVAGVNLARREAYRHLFAQAFRTEMQGVAMETGDAYSGYNRAGVYILDDWR